MPELFRNVWFKSPDGNLINLDFVMSVTISANNATKVLVKYPVTAGVNSVDVITCVDAATATALKNSIQDAIAKVHLMVDLS